MSFASLYESPWHHPGIAWLATLATLLIVPFIPSLAGPRRRWLVGLQLIAALDALFTGAWSPVAGWPTGFTAATVVFVILGDVRYLVLVQDPTRSSPAWRLHMVRALLLSASFSLLAYLVSHALPPMLQSSRSLFLTFEIGFIALLLVLRRFLPAARDPAARRAQRLLTGFEFLQYGLWVVADLWILYAGAAADQGYALRLLPNAMYYAGFAAFAARFGIVPESTATRTAQSAPPVEPPRLAV